MDKSSEILKNEYPCVYNMLIERLDSWQKLSIEDRLICMTQLAMTLDKQLCNINKNNS